MPRYWNPIFFLTLIWSGLSPFDRLTWGLEIVPALMLCLGANLSRRCFVLTPLGNLLLLWLCLLILVGAHYSFARVPLFDALRGWYGGERNPFDKFAHFFQGLTPALLFREGLIRGEVLRDRRWLAVIVSALTLALSAAYELVEWWAALLLGRRADAFLAIQGDPFDAQFDMAMALLGALLGLTGFRRLHDRQLARLTHAPIASISPVRRLPGRR